MLTAASGLISLALGFVVFWNGRRRLVNNIFFLMTIFLTLWALGESLTMASTSLGGKIFWTKFQGIGEMPMIPAYLLIALYLPEPKGPMREKRKAAAIITALYAPWLLGLLFLYTTNFLYAAYFLVGNGQGVDVVRTPAFWFLTALGFAEIIVSIVIFLWERSRSVSSIARKGLLILALAPVPMLVANAIQNFKLNPHISTPQASLIFVIMLAYGIMRYGLFLDIRSITKSLLVHAAVIVTNITLFTILCSIYIFGLDLGRGVLTYLFLILTGIPFMLGYHAEVEWARRIADRYFYGRELEEGRLLRELSHSIRTVRNLGDLADSVVNKVRESMDLTACVLMLKDDDLYRVIGYAYKSNNPAARYRNMVSTGVFLRKWDRFFSFEDERGKYTGYWEVGEKLYRGGSVLSHLRLGVLRACDEYAKPKECLWREEEEGDTISIPLEVGGEEVGLLWMVARLGRVRFSLEELDFLVALSTQVAVSLQSSQLLQELLDKSTRLQRLIQGATTAQEEERIRISRELHDGLAPYFLDIIFKLETPQGKIGEYPLMGESLDEIKEKARQGLRDLRQVISDLRPSSLDVLGLEKSLAAYLERFGIENGMAVEFITWGDLATLDPLIEVTIFRVAQEALANIARHAGAERVSFSLGGDDGYLEMVIEDDGVGFVEKEVRERIFLGECLGIKGMEERAELMQGDLEVESRPGDGTRVKFIVPFPGT